IYVLEVNPRASRTVPFVAKAVGLPIAAIASRVMAGETLKSLNLKKPVTKHICVKEAVLPFARFPGVDTILGPEMRSTGEVMGIDENFARAFAKSQIGASVKLPTAGAVEKSAPTPGLEYPLPEDADSFGTNQLNLGADASVLYDAKSIGFNRDGNRYNFTGDVVLIGAGYVITADKVEVVSPTKTLTATGHVLIIHQNQVFTGDTIRLQWDTSDFVIDNAMLVASDPTKIREVSQSILGLTPQELEYEAAKKARLLDLEKERNGLRETFRKDPATEPTPELLSQYSRLLEQDLVTENSLAPSLAQQDGERRKRFERRRVFWEKGREEAAKNTVPSTVYFRLKGESLERKDGNTYKAKDAVFTPCICEDDESPAWGFQADEIEAQQEGYIDLKHPILT
ncbi:hypothetical protein EON80_29715, partial [bacterium]